MTPAAPPPAPPPITRAVSRGLRLASVIALLLGSNAAVTPLTSFPHAVARCVPCHNAGEMDQVGEWLASPYSASEGGLGCVDCHPRECRGLSGSTAAGRSNSADDLEILRRSVRLTLTANQSVGVVEAEVAVTNVGAGHHLPTGPPDRRLVLEVAARGPSLKLLSRSPGGPPRAIRLAPFATDVSHHRFAAAEEGLVQVNARLLLVSANGDPVEIANTATVCRYSASPP